MGEHVKRADKMQVALCIIVGLSDPFVLIELCPHHVFPRQSVQQTQIVKNSLNPTFDESFEL